MSEEIIKVLDALCDKMGVAVDWTAENILPHAQQLFEKYVGYEFYTSILWIGIAAVLLLISGMATGIFVPMAIKDEWSNEWPTVPAIFAIVCLTGLAIVFLAVCGVQLKDLITCCTFPEKIILDYLVALK